MLLMKIAKKSGRPVIYDKDRIPKGEKVNFVPLNADRTVDHSKAYEVEITSSGGTPQGKRTNSSGTTQQKTGE